MSRCIDGTHHSDVIQRTHPFNCPHVVRNTVLNHSLHLVTYVIPDIEKSLSSRLKTFVGSVILNLVRIVRIRAKCLATFSDDITVLRSFSNCSVVFVFNEGKRNKK